MKSARLRKKSSFVSAVSLSLWLVACSNPGKEGDTTPTSPGTDSSDARPIAPSPSVSEPTATQVVLNLKNLAGLKNISGYVIDSIDQHGFKAIDNGRFAFFTMKPGRYDIIIEAQKAGDDGSQSASAGLGIRINGLQVKAGENTTIKDPIELLPTFAIKGKVHLLNGVTHGAINVAIPGTRIKAQSTADGSFELKGVPSGQHAVVASNNGYLDAVYDSRIWNAQDAPELGILTLLPGSVALPTGIHYKGVGISSTEENVTTLFLARPNGMNKFRVSETADFAGAAWQDFQSSIDLKFPAGGERKVFVQYAKDQQFSAVFNVEIPVAAPSP
jgi:hypothetical protein